MREMKDSGIEWCGDIPASWNTDKGKHFMRLLDRPVRPDDEVITCFRDGEVTLRSKRREDGFTIAMVEAGYQGIEPGDLVVHGMDGFAGAIGISDSRGKGTPALNVLDCSGNKRYFMYLMRVMAFTELFISLSTGIRVRTCDTNWRKLREIVFLIPLKEEQKKIAVFLDTKCAEIDQIAADIQAEIDTLEEYRRSVITEAVTKGLDKNVEMKESEVELMPGSPSNWERTRIKYCLYEKDIRSPDGEQEPLSVSQKYGVIPTKEINVPHTMASYINAKIACPGDLVFNKLKAHLGVFSVSRYYGLVSPDYAVYRAFDNVNIKYMEYLFRTNLLISEFKKYITGVGQGLSRLYTSDLYQISVCMPSRKEQDKIVTKLDMMCNDINSIISEKNVQLTTLEEYKKSLIFEYVTGKKEVPAL